MEYDPYLDNNKFILFSDNKILFDRFADAKKVKKLKKIKVVPGFESEHLIR